MKENIVRVPFEIELAKKITNGDVDGEIVTRNGESVRIVCWDFKRFNHRNYILGIIDRGEEEVSWIFNLKGQVNSKLERKNDLMLEIPEYLTFKDGDILICECGTPFIYKDTKDRHGNFSAYCGIDLKGTIFSDMKGWTYSIKGYANEEQKKIIIDALKASKEPKAKECLKMLGIEVKPECEFKPKDWILCRCGKNEWTLSQFSHIYKNTKQYVSVNGLFWEIAIPYNEQTAHLLGTTDNLD